MARLLAPLALLLSLLLPRTVLAHAVGLSSGDYEPTARGLHARLMFAQAELITTLPNLDANSDGDIAAPELVASRAKLRAFVAEGLLVKARSSRCKLVQMQPRLADGSSVSLDAWFECAPGEPAATVELSFLRRLGREHRHRVALSDSADAVYFGEDARFALGSSAATPGTERAPLEYLGMGFWHILRGLDHVAFLVALLLSLSRLKTLLVVQSAFTLAHSLSLALVTCGVWAPSSRWVEPAIALSIVYVALEAARRQVPKRPVLVAFVFGALHGMGFASALRELALPARELPTTLLLFNGGVELGQLLLLGSLLPALQYLRRHDWCVRRGLPACALTLAVCGACWFAARIA